MKTAKDSYKSCATAGQQDSRAYRREVVRRALEGRVPTPFSKLYAYAKAIGLPAERQDDATSRLILHGIVTDLVNEGTIERVMVRDGPARSRFLYRSTR